MYMLFLNWRFSVRLEHYNAMQGPYGGGPFRLFVIPARTGTYEDTVRRLLQSMKRRPGRYVATCVLDSALPRCPGSSDWTIPSLTIPSRPFYVSLFSSCRPLCATAHDLDTNTLMLSILRQFTPLISHVHAPMRTPSASRLGKSRATRDASDRRQRPTHRLGVDARCARALCPGRRCADVRCSAPSHVTGRLRRQAHGDCRPPRARSVCVRG
jgi:hypothetical protein